MSIDSRALTSRLIDESCARKSLMNFGQYMLGPNEFIAKHYLARIADAYERLERRENTTGRVMVSIPTQHGKSTLNSLFLAWYLARNPSDHIISTAYSDDLVSRNSRALQLLLNDERLPWPGIKISEDSHSVGKFNLAPPHKGFVRSCSVRSPIQGFSADLILVDDPTKDMREASSEAEMEALRTWWTSTILSRVVNNTVIIVTAACYTQSDLLGYLLNSPGADTWEKHFYPALAEKNCPLGCAEGEPLFPEKQSLEVLLQKKKEMPPQEWQAIFCCNPTNRTSGVFLREWFDRRFDVRIGEQQAISREQQTIRSYMRIYSDGPSVNDLARKKRIFRLSGVDAASTVSLHASYTSTCTMETDEEGLDIYLLEMTRERVRFDGLRNRVVGTYLKWRPSCVLLERASSAIPLSDELHLETSIPIQDIVPRGTKSSRYDAVSGICEQRRIILPRNAPWIDAFLDEIEVVSGRPNEVNDQADSFSLVLFNLNEQVKKRKARMREQERMAQAPWVAR